MTHDLFAKFRPWEASLDAGRLVLHANHHLSSQRDWQSWSMDQLQSNIDACLILCEASRSIGVACDAARDKMLAASADVKAVAA